MWEEFSRHLRVTVLSNIGYSFAYNIFIELIQFIIHNDILRDTGVLNDDLLFLHPRTDIFNNFHRFFLTIHFLIYGIFVTFLGS